MYIKKVKYKETKTGCWECTSHAPAGKGYPYIQRNYKNTHIARYIWEKYKGTIPEELQVLHKCDNRMCVNPSHLYLGTNADNMRDKAIRERCVQMKISNKDVLRIRELSGKIPRKYLALYYGVRVNTICRIINRKRRRHI